MGMWDVYRRRRELEALKDQAAQLGQGMLRRLDSSPLAKTVAGKAAESVGQVLGAGRGVVHDAEGLRDGAVLAANLANSRSSQHDAAVRGVTGAMKGAVDYVKSRGEAPRRLLDDARQLGTHLNQDLNPKATPEAASLEDEMRRRLDIGMKQGEAVYNVATVVLPVAGELKSAAELGRFAKAGPAKYIKMGASPELANYLATPYDGVGHHSIIPQRAKSVAQIPVVKKVAKALKVEDASKRVLENIPIPKSVIDSPFNVVKPQVERGQFYQRHVGLDKYYGGGNVSGEFGGGGWSGGRDLGWTKYNQAERLLYGTPGATKGVLVGGPAVLEGLGEFSPDREQVDDQPQVVSSPQRRRAVRKK